MLLVLCQTHTFKCDFFDKRGDFTEPRRVFINLCKKSQWVDKIPSIKMKTLYRKKGI